MAGGDGAAGPGWVAGATPALLGGAGGGAVGGGEVLSHSLVSLLLSRY